MKHYCRTRNHQVLQPVFVETCRVQIMHKVTHAVFGRRIWQENEFYYNVQNIICSAANSFDPIEILKARVYFLSIFGMSHTLK